MTLDLEEQEKLEELKAWWKRHGKWVLIGVTAFVLTVVGWRVWTVWDERQSTEAAMLFERAMQAAARDDDKALKEVTALIMDNHRRSGYAAPAAWLVGKANFEAGDLKSARAQYQYAFDHAREPGVRELARLRLAAILIEEKDYPAAMKLLETRHDGAFAGLFAQLKGDVLVAQGQAEAARAAYRVALDKLGESSPLRPLVEIKLDALGGE